MGDFTDVIRKVEKVKKVEWEQLDRAVGGRVEVGLVEI